MSTSSESAEQLVRIYLEGTEFILKISGSATKNIIAALYAISKDTRSKKGKTRLSKMLKSENELKIFSIKKDEMKIFAREAKTYGVYYTTLVNKNNKNVDEMVDIMVGANDAPKVNRIIERYSLSTVDKATIENAIEQNKIIDTNIDNPKDLSEETPDKGVETKNVEDSTVDDIFSKPVQKEENQIPLEEQGTENHPLGNFSNSKNKSEGTTKPIDKPSVKKELKEIAETLKKEEAIKSQKEKGKVNQNTVQKNVQLKPNQTITKLEKKER